jgi:alanine racemase
MNRLGFYANEFQPVYQRLLAISYINHPISIMTHFSSADDSNNQITQKQLSLFKSLTNKIPGERSLANSAAIVAWPDSISDWVRPGIMLYGVSPFSERYGKALGLKPVMSLHSRLISVKNIASGEAVGYAGSWVSNNNTRLGIVAIGYGDGYPRYAKSGTPVLVNGKRVVLVGRVSMDMITVDLSTQSDAKPGDPVTLWGQGLAVEEIAKYSETIPYTLLCGVTQRVEIINL